MIVVSDTSVITSLIHIESVSLLKQLFGAVIVPEAVKVELQRTHESLPEFIEVRSVENRAAVTCLATEIDWGEAEAIVLAKQLLADLLLIDEKLGRIVALREGLRVTGLLGVLLEAKRVGLIQFVRPLIERLERDAGFRVSTIVKQESLRLAGES